MAQILGLPKLSPTMEEGVLLRWVKKEGDKVSPGDLVAEVETDKANMDFNIEDEGTLLKLLVKEGQTVKLGAPVAIIGKPGDDIAALLAQAQGQMSAAPATATPPAAAAPAATAVPAAKATAAPGTPAAAAAIASPPRAAAVAATPAPPAQAGAKLLASPLAKTLAAELGIDLRTVRGSGPGGRIVERDVRAAAGDNDAGVVAAPLDANDSAIVTGAIAKNFSTPIDVSFSGPIAAPHAPASVNVNALATRRTTDDAAAGDFVDVPASNMRKRIAARLTEAKNGAPHFYLMRQFDAAPLLAFRARLNDLLAGKGKISVNDLIIKAVALALRRVPGCNASWIGEGIRYFQRVHIGVAVAIEDGLVTPVVRDTDLKGIGSIASEVADLADRARTKHLKGHEITGSTFTISNLGMFGIERFTAIINPPEAGILAVGTIVDTPVVKDGAVVPGKRMTLTMSCDHRVIDGALGAEFLAALIALLEKPEALSL
ncbi:MAG: 2-oxo acid dehydrogenase subunit E2 [Myxococcales bacterium]|nr:2-oxo acid dehydrogenase subunit E2 [Myxococcales bacterium]